MKFIAFVAGIFCAHFAFGAQSPRCISYYREIELHSVKENPGRFYVIHKASDGWGKPTEKTYFVKSISKTAWFAKNRYRTKEWDPARDSRVSNSLIVDLATNDDHKTYQILVRPLQSRALHGKDEAWMSGHDIVDAVFFQCDADFFSELNRYAL